MEYDQNEKHDENQDQQTPQFDPAGGTRQKLLFLVIAIVVVVAAKFILGL
jgi:hypothetical protein